MPELQSNFGLEKTLFDKDDINRAITNHSLGDLIEYL